MLMGDLNAHINSDDCENFIYNDDDNILESFLTNNYTSDNHQLFRNTQTQQITNTYGKTFQNYVLVVKSEFQMEEQLVIPQGKSLILIIMVLPLMIIVYVVRHLWKM